MITGDPFHFGTREDTDDCLAVVGPIDRDAPRRVYNYPPALTPARGQTAAQQEVDAKDYDHQVHSAARSMFVGAFTAWSTEERDKYVACMQGKGYTPTK
jgi:hypothetical protein